MANYLPAAQALPPPADPNQQWSPAGTPDTAILAALLLGNGGMALGPSAPAPYPTPVGASPLPAYSSSIYKGAAVWGCVINPDGSVTFATYGMVRVGWHPLSPAGGLIGG